MTGAANGAGAVGERTGPADFAVLLPPGWVRLPLHGDVRAAVVHLVAQRVAQAPVEHREALRTALTRELLAATARAEQVGGIDVLLNVEPVRGIPVPASCLVSYLDPDGAQVPVPALLDQLSAPGATVELVELAGGAAVRRLSTRREPVEPVPVPSADRERPAGMNPAGIDAVTITDLSFFVPLPGRPGVLVLAFSTPIEPLAEAMTALFDAIAGSLRWVWR